MIFWTYLRKLFANLRSLGGLFPQHLTDTSEAVLEETVSAVVRLWLICPLSCIACELEVAPCTQVPWLSEICPRQDVDLEGPVVTATQMTRLDVGELPGWQLSFSQSRQTGHALFNNYPSICPLSLISVWKPVNTSQPAERLDSHSHQVISSRFQEI